MELGIPRVRDACDTRSRLIDVCLVGDRKILGERTNKSTKEIFRGEQKEDRLLRVWRNSILSMMRLTENRKEKSLTLVVSIYILTFCSSIVSSDILCT